MHVTWTMFLPLAGAIIGSIIGGRYHKKHRQKEHKHQKQELKHQPPKK